MSRLGKILATLLMGALVFALIAGCSSNGTKEPSGGSEPTQTTSTFKPKGERLKIGMSNYTLGAPYFAELSAAAEREAKKRGFDFVATDAQNDLAKQLADVEDLLAKNIDILIFNPKDPIGGVPAAKMAHEAGVPVIIVDSSIDPSAPYVTLIQSNNSENGFLVGEWIAEQMRGKEIKMALMSGSPGNPVGQTRRDGVFAGIIEWQLRNTGKAGFQIVAQGWGEWSEPLGQQAMEDIVVAHSDINLLLCENDSMCLGAMKVLEENNMLDQVLIAAAADGQKEAIKLIMEGRYGATGSNNPTLIGTMAVEVAAQIAEGKTDFPKITYTPPIAITKANAAQHYNPDSGF